jgi:hypothetical protein
VTGVRSALTAGSAAVSALVRGWNGDIGLFTNRVNPAALAAATNVCMYDHVSAPV